ncbi:oligosaccharide repeat unit polymerase [Photobacterium gaetbulicola]|uniref:ExoQ family protein n=1 Tax=Photobacterium gaetbulicola Gung47 TaxID=658445 RepID=A0A0C5WW68_9GAMM|nr:oligosaccharide repeat unit polymerase [Photobacterium gaetbulicola]AJR07350.1 ExoQ family protein [Photobacterium gaetbulicola Gung47]PSU13610.1 oligosaccharide repeat unit polymerase [Photobacterium gaetbulicola]
MTRPNQWLLALTSCCLICLTWMSHGNLVLVVSLLFVLPFVISQAFLVCVGFIIFSYFRIHEAFPVLMPLKIPQLLALASLAGLGWQLWSQRETICWHRLQTLILLFSGWVLVSCVFATNRGEAFASLNGNFIKIVIMVFAISWLPQRLAQLKIIPYLLLLSGLLIGGLALFNKANGIGLVEGTRVTISRDIGSMLGDPNDLALVLQFPVSFAMAYSFHGPKWQRALSVLVLLTMIMSVLATQSRGGLLGIASVVFAMALMRSRSIVLPTVISGIGLLALVLLAGISERSSGGAAEAGIDESAMGRIYAWQAAFNMAISNPFTGVGLNNFFYNYYFYSPHWDGKNHAVHSTWLQILSETGFVGLVLFLLMLIGALRVSYQLLKRLEAHEMKPLAQGLWLGTLSFCVGGTFLTQGTTWPLYILIGLLLALDRLTLNQEANHARVRQGPSGT